MGWFRLAHRLGMPVQACRRRTTSSEYVQWLVFLDAEEWYTRPPLYYYLARIALEVRRLFMKHPKQVQLKHMLLDFRSKGRPQIRDPDTRRLISKAAWGAVLQVTIPENKAT